MKDKLKHIVHYSLKDTQIAPPANVWDRLEESLDAKKKSTIPLWIKRGGIAASILASLFLFETIIKTDRDDKFVTTTIINDTIKEKPMMPTFDNKNALAQSINVEKENHVTETIQEVRMVTPKAKATNNNNNNNNNNINNKEYATEPNELKTLPIRRSQLACAAVQPAELKVTSSKQETDYESIINENIANLASNKEDLTFKPALGTQYSVFNAMDKSTDNPYNSEDHTNMNVSGGISLAFNSNKRFGISTGIYYSQMNQTGSYPIADNTLATDNDNMMYGKEESIAIEAPNNTWGYVNISPTETDAERIDNSKDYLSSNTITSELSQTAGYMEVPLILKYALLQKKIGLDILGGINSNFLVVNQASLSQGDETKTGQTDGLKTFTSNGVAGLSLYYAFDNKFNITLEPKVKYYYENLTNSNNIEFKPFVIGIYAGMSYNF